jgi:hypothetical protein
MKTELPIKECAIELPEWAYSARDMCVLAYITFSPWYLPTR